MSSWHNVTPETLDQVVKQTISLLIESDACPDGTSPRYRGDDFSVAVYCDTNQQSAVLMRCSRALAVSLTSKLLEVPAEEVQEADMLDATGEVVNVIAGSLRGLMLELSAMSTPFGLSLDELERFSGVESSQYRVGQETFHLMLV